MNEIEVPLAPGACCDTAPCSCQDAPIDHLAEIQARAAKATEGLRTSDTDPGVVVTADGQPVGVFGGSQQDHHDATFTAHARADMDYLLREVLALRSELAATTDQLERLDGELVRELVRLRDENRAYERDLAIPGEDAA
ncbi:hypothetical protein ABT010_13175 [Streptomyces sp. NPDC002668]|uniref:hypothetical protein n=1 Tax=Streptomyces sp. NPDC002668 TaxID=3154422 RepID=UPI0033341466